MRDALLALCLASWLLAPLVRAQDAGGAAPPPEETAPAETADEAPQAMQREEEPPPPREAAVPAVPPIMVAVLALNRAPAELADTVRAHIVAQVATMAGGRPVLPLMHAELTSELSACGEDAACVGGMLARAGAIGAIVVRLDRARARGPVEVRIAMLDPVSGAARVPPILATLEEGADVAAVLTPLVEQLRAMMFSPPPPPPTLLITVNVEGATVRIDGESVGTSPLAPLTLTRGAHTVMVTAVGYSGTQRQIELEDGDSERLDITLAASEAAAIDPETGEVQQEVAFYEDWPFWVGVGGGAVALIVIGIVVGVLVSDANSQPAPDPMGIRLPGLM